MVDPCSDILICNESEIEYKYSFPADYEPYDYNPQQHMNHLMEQIQMGVFEYPRTTLNEIPPDTPHEDLYQWMEY